ncbi:unnamed protein product [Rhizophagus irregularis]|nr:unnamed protein product [Rhizophagus irregularis]
MLDYRDHVLASVRDIEELVDIGRKLNACSYYGTRKSIRQCQIVILPYNLLLQKSSRESMGISLKNNIVIIDEAHNLVDTIARKLNGFIDKIESRTGVEIHQAQQTSYEKNSSTLPSLSQIEAFFMSLTNGNQDGRVILGFQQISVSVEGKRGGYSGRCEKRYLGWWYYGTC